MEKAPRLYIADLILTTIPQEILQKYTARQLRLAFLTQLWNSKVDFSESLMTGEVRGIEIAFNVRPCPSLHQYTLLTHSSSSRTSSPT